MDSVMKTNDIRPASAMIQQRVALAKDVAFLENFTKDFVEIDCPACSSKKRQFLYKKYGLDQQLCIECKTQYISPRPTSEILRKFYMNSENYSYWADTIFKQSAAKRVEKIFLPRATYALDFLEKQNVLSRKVLEIGSAYGYFCEALTRVGNFDITCIEPTPKLAARLRELGYITHEKTYEEVVFDQKFGLISAFEVLEHLFSPENFLQWAWNNLEDGGCIYLTCPNIDGFETQILGKASETVDHEHLNLFNPKSIIHLLTRQGFTNINVTTPGALDADIVFEALKNDISVNDKTQTYLLEKLLFDQSLRDSFQAFIAANGLSTHMSVIATKSK